MQTQTRIGGSADQAHSDRAWFSRLSPRVFVAIILLTALGMRLIVAGFVDTNVQGGDSAYYFPVARNILDFGVHGTGQVAEYFRVPLYPALLAAIGLLPGNWMQNTMIVQSCFSALTAVAIFFLSRNLPPLHRHLWPLLVAASPFAALWDLKGYVESVCTNILALCIAAAFGFACRPVNDGEAAAAGSVRFAMIGLGLGLLALTRETFVLLPVALAMGAMAFRLPIRGRLWLTSLVAAALVIAPWVVRNGALPGGGYFLSRGTFGLNLWVGTWERDMQWSLDDRFPDYAFTSPADRQRVQRASATWDETFLRKRAIERIEADPFGVVATWIRRAPQTWIGTRSEANTLSVPRGSPSWTAIKAALFLLNVLLLASGAVGFALSVLRDRRYLLPALPILYVAAISLPFHSVETRYSTAVLPFFWLYAAIAWTAAWSVLRRAQIRTALLPRSSR